MIRRITDRTSLIFWLNEFAPRRAIQRSLWEGTVELLGGFTLIPPSVHKGWIVRVESPLGGKWLVAIGPTPRNLRKLRAFEIAEVPWEYYEGEAGNDEFRLRDGDHPEVYRERRYEAVMKRRDWLRVDGIVTFIKERYYFENVSKSTVHKWIKKGQQSVKSATCIKLKAKKKYNRWYSTERWVDDFVKQVGEFEI